MYPGVRWMNEFLHPNFQVFRHYVVPGTCKPRPNLIGICAGSVTPCNVAYNSRSRSGNLVSSIVCAVPHLRPNPCRLLHSLRHPQIRVIGGRGVGPLRDSAMWRAKSASRCTLTYLEWQGAGRADQLAYSGYGRVTWSLLAPVQMIRV
jgi:hypothetical protein